MARWSVSRALSGSPEISVDTRERILQVCKEMNYTANTVARAMVMKSTKLLGLILTGVNNPFFWQGGVVMLLTNLRKCGRI